MSTLHLPHPVCLETPAAPVHYTTQKGRPSYQPAAPIQCFNNKTINWLAWFRHFKDQRALQLVSYLDETAMNVAQELSDQELYNYDILVKLLGDRFDPASRVSASRSRFHGRTRHHHEDADTYADSIMELCRLGYPQSSPELRQELISEPFVRGQSDPELKKYLWVVIRTQKDRKLQTLIEVCTDFASLGHTTNVHRPVGQIFALEEGDDQEEDMMAMVDRSQWDTRCDQSLAARMLRIGRRDPNTTRTRISSVISTGSRLLQDEVFQLLSNGACTGSLPQTRFISTIQTRRLKCPV